MPAALHKHVFRPEAEKDLDKLTPKDRDRILDKLNFYVSHESPLQFSERFTSPALGEYRYRIGPFGVVFDYKNGMIVFLRIGHRREIYR